MKRNLLAVAAALFVSTAGMSGAALAHHDGEIVKVRNITVSHAWTEAAGQNAHAAEIYLTMEAVGESDRLVGATTGFSNDAIFQAPVLQEDGSVAVREVPAIAISAGQSITLQPSGMHIVLNDIKRPLQANDHFHMTLEFETAGLVEVEVEIEPRGDHDHTS